MTIETVLKEFVNDVDVTGGVSADADGNWRLNGSPEWFDLSLTYLHACRVLGRVPLICTDDNNAPKCPHCGVVLVNEPDAAIKTCFWCGK